MAIYSGLSHLKWWFSTAICLIARGYLLVFRVGRLTQCDILDRVPVDSSCDKLLHFVATGQYLWSAASHWGMASCWLHKNKWRSTARNDWNGSALQLSDCPMLLPHAAQMQPETLHGTEIKRTYFKTTRSPMSTVFSLWFDVWSRRQKPKRAAKMKTALSSSTNAKLNRNSGLGGSGIKQSHVRLKNLLLFFHLLQIKQQWWHSLHIFEYV